jgi:antitoxin component YwqK of YwqJK toxin-antitoxin module
MKFILIFITLFLVSILDVNAQHGDYSDDIDDYSMADLVPDPIDEYDEYNKALMSEECRMCEGKPCNGMIKDTYFTGELRHKGYYIDGQLTSTYKNYWDNGNEERVFKIKGTNKAEVEIFYPDGKLRTKAIYTDGSPQYWEEYYPNGKVELIEEYDSDLEYYIRYNFYFNNGNPESTLELVDKKERLYDSKEYYENGKVKEEGQRMFNAALYDYQKTGTWKVYDENGKLISTEEYYKGELIVE